MCAGVVGGGVCGGQGGVGGGKCLMRYVSDCCSWVGMSQSRAALLVNGPRDSQQPAEPSSVRAACQPVGMPEAAPPDSPRPGCSTPRCLPRCPTSQPRPLAAAAAAEQAQRCAVPQARPQLPLCGGRHPGAGGAPRQPCGASGLALGRLHHRWDWGAWLSGCLGGMCKQARQAGGGLGNERGKG